MKIEDLKTEFQQKKQIVEIIGKSQSLFNDKGCVHWSKMTGKMFGKRAIGRPMTKKCAENQLITGCICQKCYASRFNMIYPNMGAALERNHNLTPDDIYANPPSFSCNGDPTWRSNWNGDYGDENDVLVDFAICWNTEAEVCSAWTKNIDLVMRLDSVRPSNITVVQSSPMINQQAEMSPAADQLFTIYTAEFAVANNIDINCMGACRLCKRCYGRNLKKRPQYINELLKGEEKLYFNLLENHQ
jgi:hypothetical protein